jgi:hypothetical protein
MNIRFALKSFSAISPAVAAFFALSTSAAFYGDPPDDHHPWAIHDMNRPKPPVVTPGSFSTPDAPAKPPSDAIILFDGSDLSKWESAREQRGPAPWKVENGYMEAVGGKGDIQTKDQFGDCQLHVEWAAPAKVEGSSQGRGNSGIFLMGICEVQVLDNYNNPTYADGYAGSVYGVNPPLANALRPPGQFQVYDIIFRRPVYKDDKPLDPGYVTVFMNGVLVQDHTPLEGGTGHMRRTKPGPFPEKGPLKFQDHGNPTRFRNVWYRPLPPRAVEGGTDGFLTAEATTAKRKDSAASIRADAAIIANPADPVPGMLRLAESLTYETDPATVRQVKEMADKYVQSVKNLPADKLPAKKDEVKNVFSAFDYLTRFKLVPGDFTAGVALQAIIKEQRWDKK